MYKVWDALCCRLSWTSESLRMTSFDEEKQSHPDLLLQSTFVKDPKETKDALDPEKGTDTTVANDDEDDLVTPFIYPATSVLTWT